MRRLFRAARPAILSFAACLIVAFFVLFCIFAVYCEVDDVLGIEDKMYRKYDFQRDSVQVVSLYETVLRLEQDAPVSDSTARDIIMYSLEAQEPACRMTDNCSYISQFFLDAIARYSYQIGDSRAEKYADRLIERSRRWSFPAMWHETRMWSPDRGYGVPGYYRRFFTDPFYLRYKTLLLEKKYRKAARVLEVMTPESVEAEFDAEDPYRICSDPILYEAGAAPEEMLIYSKYHLATWSETARLKYLMGKDDADDWMTGTYLLGAGYLFPGGKVVDSLGRYGLAGGLHFRDLTPYMSVNYNNSDARWVYNTALLLKGTEAEVASRAAASLEGAAFGEVAAASEVVLSASSEASSGSAEAGCFCSYRDVSEALADWECAVEIVKLPSLDFSDDFYKALILRHGEAPVALGLASASEVNAAVASGNLYGSDRLWSLVWKPLEGALKAGERVYLAPDGALCSVNFGALQDADGGRLMDRFDIRQCVSTKSALRPERAPGSGPVVLFGGIEYGGADCGGSSDDGGGFGFGFEDAGWKYLEGSAKEVEAIDSMAAARGLKARLFTGREASESRFKSLSGGDAGILHIATHGFWYSKSLSSDYTFFDRMPLDDDPLDRCGLIMAGGGAGSFADDGLADSVSGSGSFAGGGRPGSADDGVLLGSEIAGMDLSSVDLVVLSACNSGLGDISYEGVAGLQRAFRQAGAGSVIMTFSSVSDEATALLMRYFYDALFAGSDVRAAFNCAISRMRRDSRFSAPDYWAPFVLID